MKLKTAAICLSLCALSGMAWAQTTDVSPSHWDYSAVTSLAQKGLILGYPDGKFLGDRTLTRYEMAAIIKRVIDRVEKMPVEKTATVTPAVSSAVSPADLSALSTLVNEYKTELTVIGADLKAFHDRMDAAEGRLDAVEEKVDLVKEAIDEPEGAIQTTISDVKKLKQIKLSGYFQGRYTYDYNPANINTNGFNTRRARLKVEAKPSEKSSATVQVDFGGTAVTTKDAYMQYFLKGDPTIGATVTAGQFQTPFGYQLTRSSSVRETPEFADVVTALLGPIEYNRGVKYSSATDSSLTYEAGLFNSAGANLNETSNSKIAAGRIRYALTPNLDAGISGLFGKESVGGVDNDKTRYGADAELYLTGMNLKAEYISGRDKGIQKWGYWAQVVRNVTKSDAGVVMYDVFNDGSGTSTAQTANWNVGWIHYLDSATKVKFFYKMPDNNKFNQAIAEVVTVF